MTQTLYAPAPRAHTEHPSDHLPRPDRAATGVPRTDDFRALFEHSGLSMARLDGELAVEEANADFCQDLGWALGTVRGRSVFDFVHQSAHVHLRGQFARLTTGKRTRITERVLGVHANGSLVPGRLTATIVGAAKAAILLVFQGDRTNTSTGAVSDRRKILTSLDARILEGVATGASSVQLAAKLYLSRQGVEYHVSTMLRKLKAANRAELVSRAYSMGVLSVGLWPPKVQPDFVK